MFFLKLGRLPSSRLDLSGGDPRSLVTLLLRLQFKFFDFGLTWMFTPHPKKHSSQRKLPGFQHSSWCSWTLGIRHDCCLGRDDKPLAPEDLIWKIGSPGLSCVPCCLNDSLQDQDDLELLLWQVLGPNMPQRAVFVDPDQEEDVWSIDQHFDHSVNTCDWWWAAKEEVQCRSLRPAGSQRSTPPGGCGSW